jgi:hypothetical protein
MTTGLALFFVIPGPVLNLIQDCFGISILGLENFGFKAPPCGRGSLLF